MNQVYQWKCINGSVSSVVYDTDTATEIALIDIGWMVLQIQLMSKISNNNKNNSKMTFLNK